MILSLVLVLQYIARYIIQQDSKLPRKILIFFQNNVLNALYILALKAHSGEI